MLVGLSGGYETGKDTALERLRVLVPGLLPDGIELVIGRLAFADKMKVFAMAALGFRAKQSESPRTDEELIELANLLKEKGNITIKLGTAKNAPTYKITGRQYLQYVGTEGGRETFGDNFWVDLGMAQVATAGDIVAFTDCRFPNEASSVLARGGQVWELIGIGANAGDTHASETPLPRELVSRTIDNTIRDDNFEHLDRQLTEAILASPEFPKAAT